MSTFLATVGFAGASAAFAVMALLLLVSWRGRVEGALLIVACALTAGWALVAALQPRLSELGVVAAATAELLRDGAWLLFLSALLWNARLPRLLQTGAWSIWFLSVALVAAVLVSEQIAALLGIGEVLIMTGLLLSVLVLVFLEQLYRNTETEAERSKIRYLVVGLALVFAYDLYVYSQGLLLNGVDQLTWTGRGYVGLLACPLIAVSARRHAAWSVQLYVSRNATFYGAAITAIGVYLVSMSATGYAIRLYGGEWGPLAQLVFLAGTGVVLVVLMLAPRVRRNLRVFLNKHFYRSRYDYRAEWLRFAETLSAPRDKEGLHGAVIESVARIVDARSGLLWVQSASGEAYETVRPWPETARPILEVASTEPCIAFMHRTKWIIDLYQYRLEPDVYDHVPLPRAWEGSEQLRLVVPLFLRDELLGLVTLSGKGIRAKLNYEEHDLLKTVGSQIATYLKQDEIQRRLSVSQQFEAYHRLAAFMLHDLKNVIAQQTLVLSNAERHRGNPAFIDDAISTISNSIQRMNRMLSLFQSAEARPSRRVLLWEVLEHCMQGCAHGKPEPQLSMADRSVHVRCDPERLAGALEHLIKNAQQATTADGRVSVSALCVDGRASITVEDDGSGMDADFIRNRLFVPFDSTKGSQGMGIGAYQTREYVLAMGGKLRVQSTPGKGTVFHIELPEA